MTVWAVWAAHCLEVAKSDSHGIEARNHAAHQAYGAHSAHSTHSVRVKAALKQRLPVEFGKPFGLVVSGAGSCSPGCEHHLVTVWHSPCPGCRAALLQGLGHHHLPSGLVKSAVLDHRLNGGWANPGRLPAVFKGSIPGLPLARH